MKPKALKSLRDMARDIDARAANLEGNLEKYVLEDSAASEHLSGALDSVRSIREEIRAVLKDIARAAAAAEKE